MTDIQMIGTTILKLWWFIVPVFVGGIYGYFADRKEKREATNDNQ